VSKGGDHENYRTDLGLGSFYGAVGRDRNHLLPGETDMATSALKKLERKFRKIEAELEKSPPSLRRARLLKAAKSTERKLQDLRRAA